MHSSICGNTVNEILEQLDDLYKARSKCIINRSLPGLTIRELKVIEGEFDAVLKRLVTQLEDNVMKIVRT